MRLIKWFFLFVFTTVVIVSLYQTNWFQKKYMYPMYYQQEVYRYALKNNLNPFLVAGVIRTESKYNPTARSPKGARGLMQLMPTTANWIAAQNKLTVLSDQDLYNPDLNIKLGTWYLSELLNEFHNNEILALAAYNGGRGNVKDWMRRFQWTYDFTEIDKIPFPETRDFVHRVQKSKEKYQYLYGR